MGGGPTLKSVERVDGSRKRATVRSYPKRKHPVVFEKMIDDWPAVERWTPSWFADTHGDRPINLFEFTHCYSIPTTMKEFVGWIDGDRRGHLAGHDDLYLSWDFSVLKHRPELRGDFDFES